MTRGISFWVNDKDSQIYFVGNPVAWLLSFLSIWALLAMMLVDQLTLRRGIDFLPYGKSREVPFIASHSL